MLSTLSLCSRPSALHALCTRCTVSAPTASAGVKGVILPTFTLVSRSSVSGSSVLFSNVVDTRSASRPACHAAR